MSETNQFTDASSTAEAYTVFGSTDMLAAIGLMGEVAAEAKALGLETIPPALKAMMAQLEGEFAAVARATAAVADEAIVTSLRETQVRPETTRSLHLQDLIVSTPFAEGTVKIGMIDELDKATNPDGYGPYWRAQEYGSVATGNIMTGRILFGHFEGPGHDAVPRGEYAGMRGAPGADFYYGIDGEESGLGTISHEDPARGFLEAGAEVAALGYKDSIKSLSQRFAGRVLQLQVL